MSLKFSVLISLIVFSLVACTPKVPSCTNNEALDLVNDIITKQILALKTPVADPQEIDGNMLKNDFEFTIARPRSYDEKIQKSECAVNVKLPVRNGLQFEETLKKIYDSQHLPGLNLWELAGVPEGLFDKFEQMYDPHERALNFDVIFSNQKTNDGTYVEVIDLDNPIIILLQTAAISNSKALSQSQADSNPVHSSASGATSFKEALDTEISKAKFNSFISKQEHTSVYLDIMVPANIVFQDGSGFTVSDCEDCGGVEYLIEGSVKLKKGSPFYELKGSFEIQPSEGIHQGFISTVLKAN